MVDLKRKEKTEYANNKYKNEQKMKRLKKR